MAYISLIDVFIAFLVFFLFHFLIHKKTHKLFPRNWPILGMLPGVLVTLHKINSYLVEVLEVSNLTFVFKGPWFSGMNMLITADPANVQHVFSSNFSNYDKGSEFKEMFDFLGEGIFTADSKLWEEMRRSSMVMLSHQGFQSFSLKTISSKIKNGLVPVLDHFAKEEMVFDLQDVFQRLAFDVTLTLEAIFEKMEDLGFKERRLLVFIILLPFGPFSLKTWPHRKSNTELNTFTTFC